MNNRKGRLKLLADAKGGHEESGVKPALFADDVIKMSGGGLEEMVVPRYADVSLRVDVPEMVRLYMEGNRHKAIEDRFSQFEDTCDTYLLKTMQSMLWCSIDEFDDESDPRIRPILDLVELLNVIETVTLTSREKSA